MDENKLTIKDVVGLALKGWSKDDIKELFDLAKSKEEASPDEAGQKTEPDAGQQEKAEDGVPEDKKEEKPDNIEEVDDLKKQITDLKAMLKESQQANNQADVSGGVDNQSDQDIINDLARSFM